MFEKLGFERFKSKEIEGVTQYWSQGPFRIVFKGNNWWHVAYIDADGVAHWSKMGTRNQKDVIDRLLLIMQERRTQLARLTKDIEVDIAIVRTML